MSLLVRINLILGVTLGIAAIALSYGCWSLLQANAKREVLREAGLMMDSALAQRNYTSAEILPLLQSQMKTEFLPQSVPFYAATQNFLKLREQHPEYTYKEATLNPTNLRDRATDWETDLIQQFRNDSKTHVSMLVVNVVVYFLVVRPIRRIAGIAEELSVGNAAGEFPPGHASELAALTRSFNRMRTSLEKAMKLLEP